MSDLYNVYVDSVEEYSVQLTISRAMPDEERPEGRGFALMLLEEIAAEKGQSERVASIRAMHPDAYPSAFIESIRCVDIEKEPTSLHMAWEARCAMTGESGEVPERFEAAWTFVIRVFHRGWLAHIRQGDLFSVSSYTTFDVPEQHGRPDRNDYGIDDQSWVKNAYQEHLREGALLPFVSGVWDDLLSGAFVPVNEHNPRYGEMLLQESDPLEYIEDFHLDAFEAILTELPLQIFGWCQFPLVARLDRSYKASHWDEHSMVYLACWFYDAFSLADAPVFALDSTRERLVLDVAYASLADCFLDVWFWRQCKAKDEHEASYASYGLAQTRTWLNARGLPSTFTQEEVQQRTNDAKRAHQDAIFALLQKGQRLLPYALENLMLLHALFPARWAVYLRERMEDLLPCITFIFLEPATPEELREAGIKLLSKLAPEMALDVIHTHHNTILSQAKQSEDTGFLRALIYLLSSMKHPQAPERRDSLLSRSQKEGIELPAYLWKNED